MQVKKVDFYKQLALKQYINLRQVYKEKLYKIVIYIYIFYYRCLTIKKSHILWFNLFFKANEDGEYVTISDEDQPKSADSSSGSKPGIFIFPLPFFTF